MRRSSLKSGSANQYTSIIDSEYADLKNIDYTPMSSETPRAFSEKSSSYLVISKPLQELSFFYCPDEDTLRKKNLELNGVYKTGLFKLKSSEKTK